MKLIPVPLLGVILFTLIKCTAIGKNNSNKEEITAIKFTFQYEDMFIKNGEFVSLKDSLLFYYYDSMTLCKLPYPFYNYSYKTRKDGVVYADSIISIRNDYKYLVYKNNSDSGILYAEDSSLIAANISADSVIKKKVRFESRMFKSTNDSLIEVITTPNQIIEKYVPKIKFNDLYPDTLCLYFTNEIPPIPFSLSPALDSAHPMKFQKGRFIFDSAQANKERPAIPPREIFFEIENFKMNEQENAAYFFKKFQNEKIKLK